MERQRVSDISGGHVADTPSKPHSPEPWKRDLRDQKTVLDGFARLVAVTTSREDAARIVSGVNASRGLIAEGLDAAPFSDALQVLYEICLYHSDVKFRNHLDRRGGLPSLLERADKAWRIFGEDAFHVEGASREKEIAAEAGGDGTEPKPAAEPRKTAPAAEAPPRRAAAEPTKKPEPPAPTPKRPVPPNEK
jgi:hypothetical protein